MGVTIFDKLLIASQDKNMFFLVIVAFITRMRPTASDKVSGLLQAIHDKKSHAKNYTILSCIIPSVCWDILLTWKVIVCRFLPLDSRPVFHPCRNLSPVLFCVFLLFYKFFSNFIYIFNYIYYWISDTLSLQYGPTSPTERKTRPFKIELKNSQLKYPA